MQLQKAIESRRSIRKYKRKSPSWKTIIECIDATRFAPMAGNLFTLKMILIDEKETINKIAQYSYQDFINQAQYLVVFVSDKTKTTNAYKERAEKYIKQQAGAAIQNFLLRLEEEGLSTCWIGLFSDEKVKEILKIPEKNDVEAIFPIGYAGENPRPRASGFRDINGSLYFNKFKNKRMKKDNSVNV